MNSKSPHRVFSCYMPAEFDQIIDGCSYSSISSGAVSSLLTVPGDVSGKLSVRKDVLFRGDAV